MNFFTTKRVQFGIMVFMICLTILLITRAVMLAKNVQAIAVSSDIQSLVNTENDLTEQLKMMTKEYSDKKVKYDALLSQVFPETLSTATMTNIIQQYISSVSQDISLTAITFGGKETRFLEDYTIYPVGIDLVVSKESLVVLLDMLKDSGTMQSLEGKKHVLSPFIQVDHVRMTGTMNDQYDNTTGVKIPTIVSAHVDLSFYAKGHDGKLQIPNSE